MLKYALANVLVRARRRHAVVPSALEMLHLQPDAPGFNDSVYLYGRGEAGLAVATRLSVRTGAPCEVWMSVRLPGEAIWSVPQVHHPLGDGWMAGGARWTIDRPGEALTVEYDGPLQREGQRVDAQVHLRFEGRGPLIDFSDGISPSVTAAALAAEPWSRRFFAQLGEIRTVHYEQVGRLTGTVRLGDETHAVDLRSVRDHSFGRRQWRAWDRHFWLSGVRDDGAAFTAAQIRYDFLGPLVAGFFIDDAPHPVARASAFDDIAARGVIPPRFSFFLEDIRGRRHTVDVEVDGVFEFSMDHGDYIIHEAIATYEVDGIPGVGICEFGWNPRG